MSFNPNDTNPLMISRDNYEEYFLLYVDNELNGEQQKAVEAFVQLHPDLQAELEILMSTKLPADDLSLEGKEALFAESMKLNAIDESLLLYIDDELGAKDKEIVEEKIRKDQTYELQHQLLLKTKLDKTEKLVYPYKKELYRHEERRRTPVYWMRAAAAIVIALGIGALVWTSNRSERGITDVAQQSNPTKQSQKGIEKNHPQPIETSVENSVAKIEVESKKVNSNQQLINREEKLVAITNANKEKNKENKLPAVEQKVIHLPKTTDAPVAGNNLPKKEEPLIAQNTADNTPKQTINTTSVTTTSADTYNNQTSATTAVLKDVADMGNEKKASLKGLLRKATRFIERRANIKATNENDELLIGAVAIQL